MGLKLNSQIADEFDCEIFRRAEEAHEYAFSSRLSKAEQSNWWMVASNLQAARRLVRAMMTEKRRKETDG